MDRRPCFATARVEIKNLFFTGSDYLTVDDGIFHSNDWEPFHGEFAIDPESGAILRLTLRADLEPKMPARSDRTSWLSMGRKYLEAVPTSARQEASPFRDNGHYRHARMERKLQSLCAF